jgi:hypothetical protein
MDQSLNSPPFSPFAATKRGPHPLSPSSSSSPTHPPPPPVTRPPRSLMEFDDSVSPQSRSTIVSALSSKDIAAAAQTSDEALRTILTAHYKQLYPHLSVLAEASYACFEDNFALSVFEMADLRRLDLPKRYTASSVWSSASDYGHGTVIIEGPAGVGKSSLLKLMARGQLSRVTVDDEVHVRCAQHAAERAGRTPPGPSPRTSRPATPMPPFAAHLTSAKASVGTSAYLASGAASATATHTPTRDLFNMSVTLQQATAGSGSGRLVILVELRHLAMQCITHSWEKVTPARLLDSALRGLVGGAIGVSSVETLAGLKAAILARPIVWLLDGFDEVFNVRNNAMQAFFRNFVFPDDVTGSRPVHALPSTTGEAVGEDVVFVTCREDQAVVNHPVLASRRHKGILRLQLKRWRMPDMITFIDGYFNRFAAAHPEILSLSAQRGLNDALSDTYSNMNLNDTISSRTLNMSYRTGNNGIDAYADAVTARLQEPTMNAWNGVPFMCDVLCFMATVDLPLLNRVTSPTEVLQFALDAMYRRNVPIAVSRWSWLANQDVLGPLRTQTFSVARDKALRVYETGSNVVLLDVSMFNGQPTNVSEFLLAQTGWLHRRSDVADGAGVGDRHTHWYFAHRCFLEYLAANSLATGEPKPLEAWMDAHVSLNAGERMMLSLLCHEISFRQLKKHRDVVLEAVHGAFLKNYNQHRDKVKDVLCGAPSYQERERLWELTGALIAVEVGALLVDDRVCVPKKHLGIIPHVKNPSYFALLLEPAARFGNLSMLKKVEAALSADGRNSTELASRALSQALAHAPPTALLAYSLDNGGHRAVIDHLLDQGGSVSIIHACECGSLVAVRRALNAHHPPDIVIAALSTGVDHGFDDGIGLVLAHLERSAKSGVGTVHLLCRGLSVVLSRALVVGQLGCFHAAAQLLGDTRYELTLHQRARVSSASSMFDDPITPMALLAGAPWPLHVAQEDLPFTFSDRHLARLVEACPGMVSLDLQGLAGGAVSDDGLLAVALHCKHLKNMNISSTMGAITDRGLSAICQHIGGLENVDVSSTDGRISNVSLQALAASSHDTLRSIDVSRNPGGIDDRGLIALAAACHALQHVNMRDCPISDDAVKVIATQCPGLVTLDVGANGGRVTDESLHLLAERCSLLMSLDVGDAEGNVTDAGLRSVAEHCTGLRFLNAGGSKRTITDGGVMLVARCCRDLMHLDVSGAVVTDHALNALGHGCRTLRSLRLTAHPGITDKGVKAVAMGCLGLEQLHVEGKGHHITKPGLKSVAARCPNLHSLFVAGVSL